MWHFCRTTLYFDSFDTGLDDEGEEGDGDVNVNKRLPRASIDTTVSSFKRRFEGFKQKRRTAGNF